MIYFLLLRIHLLLKLILCSEASHHLKPRLTDDGPRFYCLVLRGSGEFEAKQQRSHTDAGSATNTPFPDFILITTTQMNQYCICCLKDGTEAQFLRSFCQEVGELGLEAGLSNFRAHAFSIILHGKLEMWTTRIRLGF